MARKSDFHPVHESRRGQFTAKAKRAGMGIQQYASHVLADNSGASTLTKRQAAFAKAQRSWHRGK